MANTFTADLVKAMFSKSNPDTILVTFKGNHAAALYTKDMIDLIKTEPAVIDIMDTATGEILYKNPN